ncbi:ArnT family glycosyltransferase [Tautonia sociabilis]|nr:glycosyltransferase family 39 protein [Tautonia sociabilis]
MPRHFGRESVWVVAMTMLGAGLRLKGLGSIGLEHFDEGIYAQAATWVFSGAGLRWLDPGLIPYAPPGFPVLVGLSSAAIGPSGTAAILVSILSGVLTIPVLSWLSRFALGRGAGAATASLAALAGQHVVFSRTGLTDSTFLLCWSLAMVAGATFLERPTPGRAARLGLAVGLAQLVKYNGWMAGAIVALAVLLGAIRRGEAQRSTPRRLGLGLLAAIISAVVYLPWFLFVERTTGYAGLLAHHRSYVDGLAGWWPNWQLQMAQARAMEGLLGNGVTWAGLGIGLSLIGAAIGQGRSARSWGRLRSLGLPIVLVLATLSIVAPGNLAWWISLAWAPLLLGEGRPSARLVGTWFLVMAASTPLYHPYARLWLPTLAASWVAGGGLIAAFLSWARGRSGQGGEPGPPPSRPARTAVIVPLLAILLAGLDPLLWPGRVRPFPELLSPNDGVRRFSKSLVPGLLGARPDGLHLYTRPTFSFYLRTQGIGPLRIHGDLDSIRTTSPSPGEYAIIDAALGVTPDDLDRLLSSSGWRLHVQETLPTSIATLLDVRPETVFDSARAPLGSEPDSDPSPALDARPRSTVWILGPS